MEAEAEAAKRGLLRELAASAAARRMESSTMSPPPRPRSVEIETAAAPRPPTLLQRLVAALRGRFARGVDTVLDAFVASMWAALLAGNIPMVVDRCAGGRGSTVAAVGRAPESSNVVEGQSIYGVQPERNGTWHKLAKYVNSITQIQLHSCRRGSGLRIIGSILVDIGFLLCSALSSLIMHLPKPGA
ncbi:uncharacterized protein LOC133890195 [Phragmites australis]|uniref:uncharacterized protein LOC133890195 n=1 Tax=Phragmites australis TaxID=29695 RepID=UPI002D79E332|nr:uncharacterized protein LOC133890195 [Phragmites australis]